MKRVLSLFLTLCIAFCSVSAISFAEDTAKTTESEYEVFIDNFENTDKMKSFSDGVKAVELEPKKFSGFKSGLQMGGLAKGTELVYEVSFEIGSYTLSLVGDIAEYSPDFKIWLSADGETFTEDKYAEHRTISGYRIYTNPEVLKDNRFIKIVYDSKAAPGNLYLLSMEINEEPFLKPGGTRIKRTKPPEFDYSTLPSLKEAYKDYFPIGAAAEWFDITTSPDLLTTQFNAIVSERQTHWNGIQKYEGIYDYIWGERIFDFGVQNDMVVRLHALWYHPATPSWSHIQPGGGPVTEEVFRKRLEKYVKTVVSHFKGKVKYYDCVNEWFETDFKRFLADYKIFNDDEKFLDTLADVFKWAHEADPEAKLIFLDNRLCDKDKRDLIWHNIIPRIMERGVPKDVFVLGEQGHWGVNTIIYKEDEIVEGNSLESMFDDARSLGYKIAITELDLALSSAAVAADLNGEKTALTREQKHELMAKKWATIFDLFRENADIIEEVTFWNVTDNTSWKTTTTEDCVLLFDFNFEPYPAFYRLFDFEKKEPRWTAKDIVEIEYGNNYSPKELQAAYGTPEIDGKLDDIWKKTEVCEIDRQTAGKDGVGATGNVRVMWDEDAIYVFCEVKDDILAWDNPYSWFHDNVEIFISEKNQKGTYYLEGDHQLRVTPVNMYGSSGVSWKGVPQITKDGYNIELVYKMHTKKNEADSVIGFEAQICDQVDASDQRRSVRRWCDSVNDASLRPALWGEARLVKKYVKASAQAITDGETQKNVVIDGAANTIGCTVKNKLDYVSLRNLAAILGGEVRYNQGKDEILFSVYGVRFAFKIGERYAYINGQTAEMDEPLTVNDKNIMIPLDFVLKHTGKEYSVENIQ